MCPKDERSGTSVARRVTWVLPRPLSISSFRLSDPAGPPYQIRNRSRGQRHSGVGTVLAENALIFECRPLLCYHAGNRISISKTLSPSCLFLCTRCRCYRSGACSLSYVCAHPLRPRFRGVVGSLSWFSVCSRPQSSLLGDLLHIRYCR